MGNGLSVIERRFVNAFVNNSGNATRAYKQVNPSVTEGSARVLGSRLLTRVDVKDAIEQGLSKVEDSSLPDRKKVLKRFVKYADGAEKEKQYGSAVNSMREYSKIAGYYVEEPEMGGYITVIQSMINVNTQINIQQSKKEES